MLRTMAWLGAALFAGSLAFSARFYVVALAQPAPPETPVLGNALLDILLFSAFALHHSALARSGAKRALSRVLPPAAERTVYVWTASLLWLAVCLFWQPLPGLVYDIQGPERIVLYAAQLLGIVLTVRGAAVVDPLALAGIRQAAGTEAPAALKIVGPFRFVRHPIYLGWLLMVFGAPLMTLNRALFATVTSAYLLVAIPWEERALTAAFGDRYRAYQQQVRWRVLPGVW